MKIVILAGLFWAATAITAQAQIMKCVGKDGKIEFATSCPSGTTQQDTGVSSKPAAEPAAKSGAKDASKDKAAPKSLADRDAEFRKRQTDQQTASAKDAKKAAENEDRQRACQSAQSNLVTLKNRQRMFRTDPKTGERAAFDDADYERETAYAERVAAETCKS